MIPKTGVVIVSYNAAEAVRVTLASLRRARNVASYKLVLIDNASNELQRAQIRAAMQYHIAEVGAAWRYIESVDNRGFAGGNNIGISEFIDDDELSHICLLNSDVVVTDGWLDRMLASRAEIVSAVTNKADSEQCVPVDYELTLEECLEPGTEDMREEAYAKVAAFADRWHTAWAGNIVEAEPTFFCVLMTRTACRTVGLLDETFFPGGFEDDDYCMRARQAGCSLELVRSAFIHHWGSASFGQLQYEYFNERAQHNKKYLESKHGIIWRRRPEKPLVSFAMDVEFALRHPARRMLQREFLERYVGTLSAQVVHFESEFRNLGNAMRASERAVPTLLTQKVVSAEQYGELADKWRVTMERVRAALAPDGPTGPGIAGEVRAALTHIAAGIHDRVDCNFAIHAWLTALVGREQDAVVHELPAPSASIPLDAPVRGGRIARLLARAKRAARFLLRFDGIVFFGGYFYPERHSDGYFQRIQIVDRLFADKWRIYVESEELRGRPIWFDNPEPRVIVLRVTGGSVRRWMVRALAVLAALRAGRIYFHSVLRMYDNRFGLLIHLPVLRKALDIHGVVPEEFRMHDDYFSAVRFERLEESGVRNAGLVIVVTDTMRQYLQQKYRNGLRGRTVAFPMFPTFAPSLADRPLVDGKQVTVYAGGLHKWQQVPKMLDAMARTAHRFQHRFYCGSPDAVRPMLEPGFESQLELGSKTHAELLELYAQCHYGFILREDIVVNRVACPTKLVEYLAMGVVPIMDCENIGDFKSMGMRFVTLTDFLGDRLPDEAERRQMATANFALYEQLQQVRHDGALAIRAYFVREPAPGSLPAELGAWARRVLPVDGLVRRSARGIRRALRPAAAAMTVSTEQLKAKMAPCDILVQVDNFEAGGLENVVLDLNATLAGAGYRVMLLVQGNQGPAVHQARALGQAVLCEPHDAARYATILDLLQPQLVLAHYSFSGVQECAARGVPFVQIIHNVYMWFTPEQRRSFCAQVSATARFVAVSEYVKQYSVARLGVPADQCAVIPNGIDFTPFERLDVAGERTRLRAKYGIGEDEFVFLDLGAINHQKNHLGTVKGFVGALRKGMRARLVILGPVYEPQLLDEVRAYCAEQGVQDQVLYAGTTAGAHGHLAMADAFATGTFFEGAQLSLLEAVRANLPIVSSNVGCASMFAGRRGIELVEPPIDIARYEQAIWQMRSNPAFEERFADALLRTWRHPIRPDFEPEDLRMLRSESSYVQYAKLLGGLIHGAAEQSGASASLLAA
jgi:GT2 family glycosyltransferase/glycosyltransferase involved in cell wall biosynthesis